MSIRELEILKAALEGDILKQKESENKNHPAWIAWLEDSEKLLRKVSRKLFDMRSRKSLLKDFSGIK
ncbi:hypothetical protein [Cytobacillus praedii]|uniref:Uncharacterized protein n=1 Tax=Cytobacillus praedii TaxID=1742358 RepID=A0A4V2NTF4_9BACI|nr:hypothetical protein [Cytobacillus praedii]TCI99987.1 hypothetical protein E0Y62_27055 [Cytobacillus praedii]